MKNNNFLNYFEVCEKYSNIPHFIILKIELQRRGFIMSKEALRKFNPIIYQTQERSFSRESNDCFPVSLILRDGTIVVSRVKKIKNTENTENNQPLIIDFNENKFVIKDKDNILEDVYFWEKPDYFGKYTSSGIPMWKIASVRPQRIEINPYQFCQYCGQSMGCKFCGIAATYNNQNKPALLNINDIRETITEALKEKGRYTEIFLTGGSNIGGNELFDNEVDLYVKVLQIIAHNFNLPKFPSQLIGNAYNEKQLLRLYNNTGLMAYTANIEVLDRKLFEWICPGKHYYIGYDAWKERLYKAVEIFGKGYVNTGIVCGVEMAKPYGFKTEEEGIDNILKEAETLFKNGVSVVSCVWRIARGSIFEKQQIPSLEYYVRISAGLDRLRKKYGFNNGLDDYRRCGNHPDMDLARIW